MQHQEFKEWLEKNTRGFEIFIIKATESREEKNKKRTGKTKKWTEKQIERQVESMWATVTKNAYEQIKSHKGVPKFNGYQIWLDFLDEINFIEGFDESMAEIEIP